MNTCDEIFERAASIEDVAKSESEYLPDWYDKETFIKGFQEGAEYMEKRMYSEEEVLDFIALYARKELFQLESWFNYHKK